MNGNVKDTVNPDNTGLNYSGINEEIIVTYSRYFFLHVFPFFLFCSSVFVPHHFYLMENHLSCHGLYKVSIKDFNLALLLLKLLLPLNSCTSGYM